MARSFELLSRLSRDKFEALVSAAPKKVREELFRRAGIKNKGGAFNIKTTQKTQARIRKLYEAVSNGADLPDEVGEELIRQHLYNRRDLLATALDFLEVEHDHGLTDSDLDFVTELAADRAQALRVQLLEDHDEDDVELYLGFMNIPGH